MTAGSDFKPYRAPCAGDGPIDRPARDICFRLGTKDMVTPQVVAVAAWFLSWSRMNRGATKQFLDDLGLEWRDCRMGGRTLEPKQRS